MQIPDSETCRVMSWGGYNPGIEPYIGYILFVVAYIAYNPADYIAYNPA